MRKVSIAQMGHEGDGIAEQAGKTVYVPFSLPGEVAETEADKGHWRRLTRLVAASCERQQPICRHFTECGGCALQHWQDEPYRAWKRQLVFAAFAKAGIDLSEKQRGALFPAAQGRRRRLVLSAKFQENRLVLGFNRPRSHEIVAIEECPVAEPRLAAALPVIAELLARLKRRRALFHVTLTLAENGLDIALNGLGAVEEEEKLRLTDYVLRSGKQAAEPIARLAAEAEIIIAPEKPIIHFGAAAVELPPGAFLQACAEAEAYMAALAVKALGKCKNIADLFAGCGSFAFRLAAGARATCAEQAAGARAACAEQAAGARATRAEQDAGARAACAEQAAGGRGSRGTYESGANVHAVEWDKAALDALSRAAAVAARYNAERQTAPRGAYVPPPLKKISAERRDLARRPLTARELGAYDGVLFDPPRAGAEAQAREIAKSAVKWVVAVSCNPATLARDAAILLAGGYEVQSVTPIDQFLWSPHVEAVAVFRKRPPKKSWVL